MSSAVYKICWLDKSGISKEFSIQLHIDDSICIIKHKILNAIPISEKICFEELYLYTMVNTHYTYEDIYNILSKNGSRPITRSILYTFLMNVDESYSKRLENADVYTLEDIRDLFFSSKKKSHPIQMKIALGHKYTTPHSEFFYSANPFDALDYDHNVFNPVGPENIIVTQNGELLFRTLVDNTIYMTTAKDVSDHFSTVSDNYIRLNEAAFFHIYFPFLETNEIVDGEKLEAERPALIKKYNDKYSVLDDYNAQIDYLLEVGSSKKISYDKKGISNLGVTVKSNTKFTFPIEHLFKTIHSHPNIPIVKYNPGKRMENIYRIYSEKRATNGKKIPILPKAEIFKWIKEMGKERSISFLVWNDDVKIVNTFMENGDLIIYAQFPMPVSSEEAETLIRSRCELLNEKVQSQLNQVGQPIPAFNKLKDDNVDVNEIQYVAYADITFKKLDFKKYGGCVSSIFNVIDDAKLRYKRVNNYNEMDAISAYITEMFQMSNMRLITTEIIVEGIQTNFGLSKDDATKKLADKMNELQIQANVNENKKMEVRHNPGFLTTVKFHNPEINRKNLIIEISNIDNIYYLDTIPIYVNALISLFEHKLPVNKVCKKDVNVDIVPDIESTVDESEEESSVEEINEYDDEDEVLDEINDILDQFDLGGGAATASAVGGERKKKDDSDKKKGKKKGKDDESGDEDTEEEDGDGGFELKEITDKKDVIGASLIKPNPFFKKMKKLDPVLFLSDAEIEKYHTDKKFKSYSRACSSSARRQPVILSDEEKERIDREYPGSYDNGVENAPTAVKFGSDPNKKYWYVCPRYWCILTNSSMTEEDVKAGKCGGSDKIIPFGKEGNAVPKDAFVYEFTGSTKKYVPQFPSLMKDNHPNGTCIPCCYSSWKRQQKDHAQCMIENPVEPPQKEEEEQEYEDYIMGPEKVPLNPQRSGYLPLGVQQLLGTTSKSCVKDGTGVCFLRKGVENNRNQSFIGCVAEILSDFIALKEKRDKTTIPTIEKTKELIIDSIDLDRFVILHNGALVDTFDKPEEPVNINAAYEEINLSDYAATKLYRLVDIEKRDDVEKFRRIVRAYKNFIAYLRDPTVVIDHTYLWDAITLPSKKLFVLGLNLVIFDMKENDDTNNIDIVCPTTHYSSQFFDPKKYTMMLIKRGGEFYEPIIMYSHKGNKRSVQKTFLLEDKQLPAQLRKVLVSIQNAQNTKCAALPGMPRVYKFKQAIPVETCIRILTEHKYEIESQILNYNGRVIALQVKGGVVVPCMSGNPVENIKTKHIDSRGLWKDYETTRDKLRAMPTGLRCAPSMKVLDRGLIVGFLTETNQFVSIDPPQENIYHDQIPELNEHNYLVVDDEVARGENVGRNKYIRNIELETNFYNMFRTLARISLNNIEYEVFKKELENILEDTVDSYTIKYGNIQEMLHLMLDDQVKFTRFSESVLDKIGGTQEKLCAPGTGCVTLIPEKHLITGMDNETIYFGRLADELLRYTHIREMLLNPTTYITYTPKHYDIDDKKEFIILQSMLTQEYFERLIPEKENEYANTNTFYWNQGAHLYENDLKIEEVDDDVDDVDTVVEPVMSKRRVVLVHKKTPDLPDCAKEGKITGRKMVANFTKDVVELTFENCTPEMFGYICHDFKGSQFPNVELKKILITQYVELFKKNPRLQTVVYKILSLQGKKEMMKPVIKNSAPLDALIHSEQYVLTNLDLWILADYLEIPLIFSSSGPTGLPENKREFLATESVRNSIGQPDAKIYVVRCPTIKEGVYPNYKLICIKGGAHAAVKNLKVNLEEYLYDIERYLSNFL